jgi:hypothetical protein
VNQMKCLLCIPLLVLLMASAMLTYDQNLNVQGATALNTQGLLAWWKLNEGSGSQVYDSSGNGKNGLIHGCSWVSAGETSVLSFDGRSDYVSLPSLDLGYVGSLSVVAWVRSDLSQVGFIVYHGDLGEWELGLGDLSEEMQRENLQPTYPIFSVKLSDGSWYRVVSNGSLQPEVWHQVVAVWVMGDSVKVYVDGLLAGETGGLPDLGLYRCSMASSLGIYGQDQWGQIDWFKGELSNVMVYDRPLVQSEIASLYDYGIAYAPYSSPMPTENPAALPTLPSLEPALASSPTFAQEPTLSVSLLLIFFTVVVAVLGAVIVALIVLLLKRKT